MDTTSEEQLAAILAKDAGALSAGEIDFLNARRSYLNAEQLQRFATVLKADVPATPAEPAQEPAKEPEQTPAQEPAAEPAQ